MPEETVLTTSTDNNGNYLFTNVPALTAGKTYYVLFRNIANTPAYCYLWFGPDVSAFAAGQYVSGGDFDIGDIVLTSPPNNSTQALPITFTWTRRNVPADSYLVRFRDSDWKVRGSSGPLGYVASFTLTELTGQLVFGQKYAWDMMCYMSADSFGESRTYSNVTFAPPVVTPTPTVPAGIHKIYLPLIRRR